MKMGIKSYWKSEMLTTFVKTKWNARKFEQVKQRNENISQDETIQQELKKDKKIETIFTKSPSSSLYLRVTSSEELNWSLKTRCIIRISSS